MADGTAYFSKARQVNRQIKNHDRKMTLRAHKAGKYVKKFADEIGRTKF